MQAPYALALVICDNAYADPTTKKKFLMGLFSSIGATSFPAVHPIITVYFAITDGRGKTPIEIRLVTVDEDDIIASVTGEVEFKDPRVVVESTIAMLNVEFPAPGEYRMQLIAGGEFLLERRLILISLGVGNKTDEPED